MNRVTNTIIKYKIRLLRERLQKQTETKEYQERTMYKIEQAEKIVNTDLEIIGSKMVLNNR